MNTDQFVKYVLEEKKKRTRHQSQSLTEETRWGPSQMADPGFQAFMAGSALSSEYLEDSPERHDLLVAAEDYVAQQYAGSQSMMIAAMMLDPTGITGWPFFYQQLKNIGDKGITNATWGDWGMYALSIVAITPMIGVLGRAGPITAKVATTGAKGERATGHTAKALDDLTADLSSVSGASKMTKKEVQELAERLMAKGETSLSGGLSKGIDEVEGGMKALQQEWSRLALSCRKAAESFNSELPLLTEVKCTPSVGAWMDEIASKWRALKTRSDQMYDSLAEVNRARNSVIQAERSASRHASNAESFSDILTSAYAKLIGKSGMILRVLPSSLQKITVGGNRYRLLVLEMSKKGGQSRTVTLLSEMGTGKAQWHQILGFKIQPRTLEVVPVYTPMTQHMPADIFRAVDDARFPSSLLNAADDIVVPVPGSGASDEIVDIVFDANKKLRTLGSEVGSYSPLSEPAIRSAAARGGPTSIPVMPGINSSRHGVKNAISKPASAGGTTTVAGVSGRAGKKSDEVDELGREIARTPDGRMVATPPKVSSASAARAYIGVWNSFEALGKSASFYSPLRYIDEAGVEWTVVFVKNEAGAVSPYAFKNMQTVPGQGGILRNINDRGEVLISPFNSVPADLGGLLFTRWYRQAKEAGQVIPLGIERTLIWSDSIPSTRFRMIDDLRQQLRDLTGATIKESLVLEMMMHPRYLIQLLNKAFGKRRSILITEEEVESIIAQELRSALLTSNR